MSPDDADNLNAFARLTREQQVRKLAQQQRAMAWLNEHWSAPDKRCPICNQLQWSTSEVVEVRPFSGGGLVVGGPVYPTFMLICGVCGYTRLFNAAIAGILDPPEKPE
jgi:hypothetical protein